MVFVDAASVRNIADIMNLTNTVKRKKVKNLAGSGSSPARKYRIKLKQIAMMSLTGASDITPAKASVNGWWKLRRILLLNDDKRMLTIRNLRIRSMFLNDWPLLIQVVDFCDGNKSVE